MLHDTYIACLVIVCVCLFPELKKIFVDMSRADWYDVIGDLDLHQPAVRT